MPVLSWVFQKGKCKYCQVKISKFYPIIEIISIIWALLIFKFVGLPSVIIFLPIIPYLIAFIYRVLFEKHFDFKLFGVLIALTLLALVAFIVVFGE